MACTPWRRTRRWLMPSSEHCSVRNYGLNWRRKEIDVSEKHLRPEQRATRFLKVYEELITPPN